MMQLEEGTKETNEILDAWKERARLMTMEELPDFLKELMNTHAHDYGTVVQAMAIGAVATLWAMNNEPQGGITGFQAGYIKFGIMDMWDGLGKKVGMRILDYDKLLYPQHLEDFTSFSIGEEAARLLQKEAKKLLQEEGGVTVVREHWQRLADGDFPFKVR